MSEIFIPLYLAVSSMSCGGSDVNNPQEAETNTDNLINTTIQSPTITDKEFDSITYLEILNMLKNIGIID